MNDDIAVPAFLFGLLIGGGVIAFFANNKVDHTEARTRAETQVAACGVCDDDHKANVCGAYVCTQEGWR